MKSYILSISLFLFFTFLGCSTNPVVDKQNEVIGSGDSIPKVPLDASKLIGKWVLVREYDVGFFNDTIHTESDTTYSLEEFRYLHAYFWEFDADSMTESFKDNIQKIVGSSDYMGDTIPYSLSGDSLFNDMWNPPYLIANCSFKGDTLFAQISGDMKYDSTREELYFIRYDGEIPPASWTDGTRLEDFNN